MAEPGPTFDANVVAAALEALAHVPPGCTGRCAAGQTYKAAARGLPAFHRYSVFLGGDQKLVERQLRQMLEEAHQ